MEHSCLLMLSRVQAQMADLRKRLVQEVLVIVHLVLHPLLQLSRSISLFINYLRIQSCAHECIVSCIRLGRYDSLVSSKLRISRTLYKSVLVWLWGILRVLGYTTHLLPDFILLRLNLLIMLSLSDRQINNVI